MVGSKFEIRSARRAGEVYNAARFGLWILNFVFFSGGEWIRPGVWMELWRAEVVRRPRKTPGENFTWQHLCHGCLTTGSPSRGRRPLFRATLPVGWLRWDVRPRRGEKTVGLEAGRACRWALLALRFKRPTTHVEAFQKLSRDGGSIPPASNSFLDYDRIFI